MTHSEMVAAKQKFYGHRYRSRDTLHRTSHDAGENSSTFQQLNRSEPNVSAALKDERK